MAKLSPSSPGLHGQKGLIDPEIEEVLASSKDADRRLGLNNEIAVEAEIHSVVVAEVAIETSDLNTAKPNWPAIQ
jgi:hypothetical protein